MNWYGTPKYTPFIFPRKTTIHGIPLCRRLFEKCTLPSGERLTMGAWDYYSFANDQVMDFLGITLPHRAEMIASVERLPGKMSLQEVIDTWYPLKFSDPVSTIYSTLDGGGRL